MWTLIQNFGGRFSGYKKAPAGTGLKIQNMEGPEFSFLGTEGSFGSEGRWGLRVVGV